MAASSDVTASTIHTLLLLVTIISSSSCTAHTVTLSNDVERRHKPT
jgi:hypothetical protein